jgi:ribosomal protein S27E
LLTIQGVLKCLHGVLQGLCHHGVVRLRHSASLVSCHVCWLVKLFSPSGKLADLSREVSREEVCASAQLGWLARFTPLK